MNKPDYSKKIKDLLEKLPKHLCVEFGGYCAKDQLHNITDKDQYSKCLEALDITEKYMKGLASKSELKNVANAAAACYAAYYACYAANAAYYAANAAEYAAKAATNAAYSAAYYAAKVDKEIKLKEYYEVLLGRINNLSKLEKLVFNINKELK